jgi:TonB family protein
MKGRDWLRDQWQRLLGTMPRASALLLSAFLHFVALMSIVVLQHMAPVHISTKYQTVQRISGTAHVSLNSKSTRADVPPARITRRVRQARASRPASTAEGTSGQSLREQAQQATAAITMSLRFRMIYGFTRDHDYQLAVQTAGDLPPISAEELPPHFQQYVIVEVTIDTEGRVADARVVAGLVDPAIEQKLLSAIREFKYNPAKRDGVPIPSQRDIVIHIPT